MNVITFVITKLIQANKKIKLTILRPTRSSICSVTQ